MSVNNPLSGLPVTTIASTRESKIKEFTITGSGGGSSSDISAVIGEFFFYESVLSNTISATVYIVDTGTKSGSDGGGDDGSGNNKSGAGIISSLNLVGGEKVKFKIEHPNPKVKGEDATLTVEGGMYINRIREVSNKSMKDAFILDLVPEDYIKNEQNRVIARYEGKTSESVESILNDILETDLEVNVDGSETEYNFIGNARKPFYLCTWLASRSAPEGEGEGGTAGFLFYQTRKTFEFKSLDKFLESSGETKKFIYNNTGKESSGDEFNILNYSFNTTVDVSKELNLGTYNNRSVFFDPVSMSYIQKKFSTEDQNVKPIGKERNIPKEEKVIDKPTRLMHHILDVGTMPKGNDSEAQLQEWKQNKTEPNYKAEDIMVQSIMRYNQIFSIQMNVIIPGDFSISAGDKVDCKFLDLTKTDDANNQLSGIYIVASVCHKVTSRDTFTSMDLVSDSLGSKNSSSFSFLN